MKPVRCPNCGKGWDRFGDGDCDYCTRKEFRPENGQDDDLTMWPAWQRRTDENPSK